MTPVDQAGQFLRELFGRMPDGARLGIWTLQDHNYRGFEDPGKAAVWVVNEEPRKDTYVHVGFCPSTIRANLRAKSAEILGLPGFWADIDYLTDADGHDLVAGGGHKKTNLPPDEAAANELLYRADGEFPPTLLVRSGGGLQAWWLFDEPWVFRSDDDRVLAQRTVQGFQAWIRASAKERGWDVDSTHDLARVLRVPGSYNLKHGAPRLVELLPDVGARFDRVRFARFATLADEAHLPLGMATARTERASRLAEAGGWAFVLSAEAEPPGSRLQDLFDVYPEAKASWDRKRKRLQDQSASSYDMSLANFAVMAGWPDQDVVNLLIAQRRRHKSDLKLDRPDYYAMTLARARERRDREEKREDAEEVLQAVEATTIPPELKPDKDQCLEAVSTMLNVKIERLVKYMSDPVVYRITINGRNVELGGSGVLLDQAAFSRKIADYAGRALDKVKNWTRIAQALLDACEEEDTGDEGSPLRQLRLWIEIYLSTRRVFQPEDGKGKWEDSAGDHRPFIRDGQLYFATGGNNGLKQFLFLDFQYETSGPKLTPLLKALGWEPINLKFDYDDRIVQRSFWVKPSQEALPDYMRRSVGVEVPDEDADAS